MPTAIGVVQLKNSGRLSYFSTW